MPPSTLRLLRALETDVRHFGPEARARKRARLEQLPHAALATPLQVRRAHDALCFLRAYPDDGLVLETVERQLDTFAARADVRRQRRALVGSGIAGTDLRLGFYAPMARWVADRWGEQLQVDWDSLDEQGESRLADRLYLLGLDAEVPGLDFATLGARAWVDRMRGPEETDAAFLCRRFSTMAWPDYLKDTLFDELHLPLVFRSGETTPSRTLARAPGGRVVFQTAPLDTARPDLKEAVREEPVAVRDLGRKAGQAYVDLALGAMIGRDRALDAFMGGDANDVRIVDWGDGLEFVLIGSKPGWRMLLEGVYGWLMLKNRVPIGYVLSASLFHTSAIAYNVFPVWRGGEAARIYGRVLATARFVLGTDAFSVDPYQLGHENAEGIASGAWWFYQKLGFRPRDAATAALMDRELDRMRSRADYRSTPATLRRLAERHVYLELGPRRPAVMDPAEQARVGLAVTDSLAPRFSSRRDRAEAVCAEEVAAILEEPAWKRLPAREKKAWLRLAPLIRILPGLERWPRADRRALATIIRLKNGRRESDYVRAFDAHARLKRALLRLAAR